MRKVPIKFRGVDTAGNYVYGGINEAGNGIIINNLPILVEPESVSQLVGYDRNGEEVYEGDTVINEQTLSGGEPYRKEHVAHYSGYATAEDGCYLVTRQIATYTRLKK